MSEELTALRYELGRLAKLVDELSYRDRLAAAEARLEELRDELGAALVRENNLIEASPAGRRAASKRSGGGVAPRTDDDRDAAGGHPRR